MTNVPMYIPGLRLTSLGMTENNRPYGEWEQDGVTQYGEPVRIRYSLVAGQLKVIIEDMRADGAAMKELRREAKRHHRMTIVCDAGFLGKSAGTITCEELTK